MDSLPVFMMKFVLLIPPVPTQLSLYISIILIILELFRHSHHLWNKTKTNNTKQFVLNIFYSQLNE